MEGLGATGAAEWTRTTDLSLTKGVLYRLSYCSENDHNHVWHGRRLYATGTKPTQGFTARRVHPYDGGAAPHIGPGMMRA